MKRASILSVVAAVWAVGCVGGAPEPSTQVEAVSVSANPGIASIGSRPYGRSYGEWEAAWWQWTMRIPRRANPVTDTTGAHCAEGQSGDVWFLAGNYGGATRRECTVPAGKALYFPVVNWVWVQMLTDPPATVEELRTTLRNNLAGATMAASIDGRPVANLTDYYEETPVFPAIFGPSNDWHVSARQCAQEGHGAFVCPQSVDVGYALFVNPLPAGDHTVHFEAALTNGFSLDVTYTLHVR